MCSTAQSPRAANAFSRACAARTCPAPEDADKRRTRGFDFIRAWLRLWRGASRSLAAPGGDRFEDSARHALQLAETRQVILEIVVERFCFFGAKLRAQNHIPQLDGMRQQRILLQLLERNPRVVVIHKFPRGETSRFPFDANGTAPAIVLAGRRCMRARAAAALRSALGEPIIRGPRLFRAPLSRDNPTAKPSLHCYALDTPKPTFYSVEMLPPGY